MIFKEALGKMAMMCSRKEYCRWDVSKKMQNWKLSPEDKEKIIAQLISEKYIDEQRFTEAFVKDKFLFNKWGKHKIKFQLKQKQISEEHIDNALDNISEEDYLETIEQLILSKKKSVKAQSNYEQRGKLIRFMAQRGFELDSVNSVLSDLDL